MRGTVTGLGTPYPIATRLPSAFQEDEFAVRLTEGLDEVLGAVIASLDCLAGYLDPRLTPSDFLDWLAAWVAIDLDENWPLDRKRRLVAHAVDLHRHHGTAWGLQWYLDLVTDRQATLVETGAVTWSASPRDDLTDLMPPHLTIRVPRSAITGDRRSALERLISNLKPAHVPHTIEILDTPTHTE